MQLTGSERDELRDAARRLLDNRSASGQVRALLDDPTGFDRSLWGTMVELGWLAIHAPEEHGGMGASYTDLMVVLHELGRHVTPSPFIASAVLGVEAMLQADNADVRATWLPDVVGGARLLTVAALSPSGSCQPSALGVTASTVNGVRLDGTARFVPHAHVADAVVVAARDDEGQVTLALVEAGTPGLRVTLEPTFDQTQRFARVDLDDVAVDDAHLLGAPGSMTGAYRRLADVGAIAVSADALGAAEHMLEVSSTYARERHQFGRAIGSFQAVKHHCANMLIAVESSRAALAFAASTLDSSDGDLSESASVVKSYVGPACSDACETAVQVHGGIGFTWEHDAHLYLKRTKLDESLFGSTAWHRRRLGGLLVG